MERHIFVVRSRAAANKGLKEMAVVGYLNICASIKISALLKVKCCEIATFG